MGIPALEEKWLQLVKVSSKRRVRKKVAATRARAPIWCVRVQELDWWWEDANGLDFKAAIFAIRRPAVVQVEETADSWVWGEREGAG